MKPDSSQQQDDRTDSSPDRKPSKRWLALEDLRREIEQDTELARRRDQGLDREIER
jgi:hypothetical protein